MKALRICRSRIGSLASYIGIANSIIVCASIFAHSENIQSTSTKKADSEKSCCCKKVNSTLGSSKVPQSDAHEALLIFHTPLNPELNSLSTHPPDLRADISSSGGRLLEDIRGPPLS